MWPWLSHSASKLLALALLLTAAILPYKSRVPSSRISLPIPLSYPSVNSSFPPLPLSVSSRWVVDSEGSRTKLACVSWVGHLEAMIPEGLNRQSLQAIADLVHASGFNCVRLTFAIYMFTRADPDGRTADHLASIGLSATADGIRRWNPDLVDLPLVDVFDGVVTALGRANVMVILDNHVSKPGWCCSYDDGDGFWGDAYFDPDEWIDGLSHAAELSLRHDNVIGMSLRNEPRGPRQNAAGWRKYMTDGAEAVHAINSNLLVLMSGLSFACDLSFLKSSPLTFNTAAIRQKLVYEVHWYAWFGPTSYSSGNVNDICAADMQRVMNGAGFVLTPNEEYTSPLFVSEFGMLMSGQSEVDNKFMDCYFALAAKMDMDWALWLLPGTYYLHRGQMDFVETYGLVTPTWDDISNSSFLNKLRVLQRQLPGPSPEESESSKEAGTVTYTAIFHPATGLCVSPSSDQTLELSTCGGTSSIWAYDNSTLIKLKYSSKVITALADGSSAELSEEEPECEGCRWNLVSGTLQLSAVGMELCLDAKSGSTVVTTETCRCVSPSACVGDDPRSQWFQFISP